VTPSIGDLLVFVAIALVVGAVGIALGILVLAPRLIRLADRDEEPGDPADDRPEP
jgi:hypothetical protein